MKRVNFWKTLFLSALAVTAFTGCSNDDSDEGGVMPSITVNGQSTATLAVGLAGGATEAVTIESSGAWTLKVEGENGAAVADCVPSLTSGNGGTSTVTFNLAEATAARTYKVTVTTSGTIPGVGVTADVSATIKVEQTDSFVPTEEALYSEDCGTTGADDKPSVGSFTGWSRKGSLSQANVVYGGSTSVRTGTGSYLPTDNEKNAVSGPNWVYVGYNDQTFDIQKINVGSATNFSFTFTAQLQNGYENGPKFAEELPSTFIKFSASTDGVSYSPVNLTTKRIAADGSWFLCTAEFKLPAGVSTSTISVRLSEFDKATDQYQLRIDDFKLYEGGNGSELPAPEPATKTTIDGITEADKLYEVADATVVGTYKQGFVMQDKTGAILVFMGDGVDVSTIPAEGSTVSVSGKSSMYGGALQLASPTILSTAAGTMPTLTPTEVTADNIAGMMTAPKVTYVKMTGTLSAGSYVNLNFLFDSKYTGTLSSPNDDLNVNSLNGKVVDVEGWFVNNGNKNNNGVYFTVVACKVAENTAVASGSFTKQPDAFEATNPQSQTLTFEANAVAGTVKFSITGTNNDKFSYSYTSGNTVTVSAVGNNESSAAYTATLNLLSAAGDVLASVDLTQKAAGVTQEYTQIRKVADLTAGEYLMGGYGTTANVLSLYTSGLSSKNGYTSTYTFDENSGSLTTTENYEAVVVVLEAVDGVANAYKIKDTKTNQYLTATKASSGNLALVDATDLYWILSDGPEGSVEQDIVAKQVDTDTITDAAMVISTTAGSKVLRSWNLSGDNKANGLVFFKKNF